VGIGADAIHGNKAQNHRTRTLKRFKDNELRVLVATDIAARGLDIEALPHVVNFDLPHVAEDYVHRIGRTGRAGAEGEAVSLVSHEDRPLMAAIERLMNRNVEERVIAGFENRGQTPNSGRGQTPNSGRPQHQPRQRQGQQPRRPEQRHGNRGQSPRSQSPGSQRFNGQRRGGRAGYGPSALPAPIAKERDAQIAEARARMAAEGEPLPAPAKPAPAKRRRYEPQLGALLDKRSGQD
jgi:ATP-dependent RNA helicase RhlE